MKKDSKIYVAGHTGLVGSSIVRELTREGYTNLLLKTRAELDLFDQNKVLNFFETEKPEYVFLAAAKVGGIGANKEQPATYMLENLMIEINVLNAARLSNVTKLLFLGSSCIYPKEAPQPMKEEYLLSGKPESTNAPYSMAKIAGITLCQSFNKQYGTNFISVMPTNLYGEGDNFDLNSSHVIPALIRKFHEAKQTGAPGVDLWGSGSPKREFLYVDDLASACLFLMEHYNDGEIINIGTGKEVSIRELTELVSELVGYSGEMRWDTTKPEGVPRKLLDVSKLTNLGWTYKTDLKEGLEKTYTWFKGTLQ